MSRYKKDLGVYGENLACQFLIKRGYIIIDRNFSSKYGEIDIFATHPKELETLCAIEVKTRISSNFGQPEEAVTPNKIKRLHDTACSYFFQNKIEDKVFRLDIVSIFIDQTTKKARIKHLKGINYENA
jgi:putative endonuclease